MVTLEGDAFQFYYQLFARNGELSDNAKDYSIVMEAFLKQYELKEGPGTLMREEFQAGIDLNNFRESLRKID